MHFTPHSRRHSSRRLFLPTLAIALVGLSTPFNSTAAAQPFYVDSDRFHQDSPGIAGRAEADDRFGSAVAIGDFNNDGYDDLAIGTPAEDIENGAVLYEDAGVVQVLYGGANGLSVVGDQLWHIDTAPTGLTEKAEQLFGAALVVGDFNRDGYDDLAIGAPDYDIITASINAEKAGLVVVLFGSSAGLDAQNPNVLWQAATAVVGEAEAFDRFGFALGAGDIDGDTYDDLVVGIPGQNDGSAVTAGAVQVFYGSDSGVSLTGEQVFDQTDISGLVSEWADQFGFSLFVGRLNGDAYDDVAVGAPYEAIGDESGAGAVTVLFGGFGGLTSVDAVVLHQNRPGVPGLAEAGDFFGWSLHGARLESGSGPLNLIVGVPDENRPPQQSGEGAFHVFPSHGNGPVLGGQIYQQDTLDPSENPHDERFAAAIASADVNHDGVDDLLIAAPGNWTEFPDPTVFYSGRLHLYYGENGTLDSQRTPSYDAFDPLFLDQPEHADRMGQAIAFGDFDNNGSPDMVAATPLEDLELATEDIERAGVVHVLYAAGPDAIFIDGFESGDLTAWED